MKNECLVRGLTNRGQAIVEKGKKRHTVKDFNYRLYKYYVNGELMGCRIVNLSEMHPTKRYGYIVRV